MHNIRSSSLIALKNTCSCFYCLCDFAEPSPECTSSYKLNCVLWNPLGTCCCSLLRGSGSVLLWLAYFTKQRSLVFICAVVCVGIFKSDSSSPCAYTISLTLYPQRHCSRLVLDTLLVEPLEKCLSKLLLYMPRNVSARSRGDYVLKYFGRTEGLPYNSHSVYTILPSHFQCTKVLISPHISHQLYFLTSSFSASWCFTVCPCVWAHVVGGQPQVSFLRTSLACLLRQDFSLGPGAQLLG